MVLWNTAVEGIRLRPADSASPVVAPPLLDADGRTTSLAQLRGEVIIVNHWASWCRPCRTSRRASRSARVGYADRVR